MGLRVEVVKNEFARVAAKLGPALLQRMPPVLMQISAVIADDLAEFAPVVSGAYRDSWMKAADALYTGQETPQVSVLEDGSRAVVATVNAMPYSSFVENGTATHPGYFHIPPAMATGLADFVSNPEPFGFNDAVAEAWAEATS